MSGIISGVLSGVIAGVLAAKATVNKLASKIKGDGNTVAQGQGHVVTTGNTSVTHIYASPQPPEAANQPGTAAAVGPYLVPFRDGKKFYVRNAGDADAFDPTWTASASNGEPSVIPTGIELPNPMGRLIETPIAHDAKTFGSGATTIEVTWKDAAGRVSSNRLNV